MQQRGAAIINARKLSSAMSAAKAISDHMRDFVCGSEGRIVSMGVPSDGSYGIEPGLIYSFPLVCMPGGTYKIVQVRTSVERDLIHSKKRPNTLPKETYYQWHT